MIEQPYEGRASVDFDGIRLTIKIPSKKIWFIILFLTAWMGGWFMGEKSALTSLLASGHIGSDSFLLFWFVGWSVGGFYALMVLLWSLFGQETIVFEQGILSISKGILDIRLFTKNYDFSNIKNLELNPEPAAMETFTGKKKNMGDYVGFTGGKLRFDYGMKTIKFGIGIDEAEARYLLDEIKKQGF